MNRIIVSFTSYPKRIHTVHKVIDSIIKQTILPDKIILYLSSSEFKNYEGIPDFRQYEKYGFEIHWRNENLRSHKKWYYAFQEYPDDIIIVFDDDILYKETAIEMLMKYHEKFPNAVIARRAHLITGISEGILAPYSEWYKECTNYVGIPRMDLLVTTGAGALYPPYLFGEEVLNRELFIEKCQYADDIWMKIMEVYYGIPVVLAESKWEDVVLNEYQSNCLFDSFNDNGGNDKQLEKLMKHYTYVHDESELILKRIFSTGCILCTEARIMERNKMEKVLEELLLKLKCRDGLLVYGAGTVGKGILGLVKSRDIEIIQAFVVNDVVNNPKEVDGIPVRDYREYTEGNEKIVIALYNRDEAEKVKLNLVKCGIDKKRILLLSNVESRMLCKTQREEFNSAEYWERRYVGGGNSGSGSYNRLAEFKAKVINEFVEEKRIKSVIEWGCGDGNQLRLAQYPDYIGFDVSKKAVDICKELFDKDTTKQFGWCGFDEFENHEVRELALSLDVIYHLVEDDVYEKYMQRLFNSSNRYVCIYSSNFDKQTTEHVKHRRFTEWINTNLNNKWILEKKIDNKFPYLEEDDKNTSNADFYFYKKIS